MLHICQGNCLCESTGNNFAKAKVLYCYGEVSVGKYFCKYYLTNTKILMYQVVLQRSLPGASEEEEEESPWFLDIDMLQILQLILVVFFILAM